MTLRIAPNFELPDEAVTETFAILARRGAGKTYTAKVFAEELIEAGYPVVILDPVGVWHGLRSNAAGTGTPLGIPRATDEGLEAARSMGVQPLPVGPALLDYWRGELGERERRFLDVLIEIYPDVISQPAPLGELATRAPSGRVCRGCVTLGLAQGWRASDEFMQAIA